MFRISRKSKDKILSINAIYMRNCIINNGLKSCFLTRDLFNSINVHTQRHFSQSWTYNEAYRKSFCKESILQKKRIAVIIQPHQRKLSFAWLDDLTITQSKIFQNISQSSIVEKSMNSLQYFHDYTHLPWWMSIILSTFILRTVITLPLAIYQNYIFAKVENLQPEMGKLVKELKRETAIAIKRFNWDKEHARKMYNRSARRLWNELIVRENCHPFKASLLLWAQIPLWVVISVSYRNMASMYPYKDVSAQILFLQLETGGFGWLPNLTIVDHSLILPFTMAILNILIVDVTTTSKISLPSKRQKYLSYFFKFISVLLIPIAANVPGCIVLYWTTSSLCGLTQNLLLLHPKFRRACGIPHAPSERVNPYQHLADSLKSKYLPYLSKFERNN